MGAPGADGGRGTALVCVWEGGEGLRHGWIFFFRGGGGEGGGGAVRVCGGGGGG